MRFRHFQNIQVLLFREFVDNALVCILRATVPIRLIHAKFFIVRGKFIQMS